MPDEFDADIGDPDVTETVAVPEAEPDIFAVWAELGVLELQTETPDSTAPYGSESDEEIPDEAETCAAATAAAKPELLRRPATHAAAWIRAYRHRSIRGASFAN